MWSVLEPWGSEIRGLFLAVEESVGAIVVCFFLSGITQDRVIGV